jgi:hypothetical protein
VPNHSAQFSFVKGEIATLTSEVQRLQTTTDWWTNATVLVTALTALVAVGYFIVSRVAINRAAQLRTAQAALDTAKEEKLTNDLRDKDKEIAEAKARAAEANRLLSCATDCKAADSRFRRRFVGF